MTFGQTFRTVFIHLRLPFSFFLLPIFFFAAAETIPWENHPLPLFLILHFIIYPASNGYNSLMDRDTGSIGGIENPIEVPPVMFIVTLIMDIVGLALTYLLYGTTIMGLMILYVLASRAYSYRGIRLKKYPIISYLTVVIFQGALVFFMSYTAIVGSMRLDSQVLLGMFVSLTMIGASYPLTQIYQHEQDADDGVKTLSSALGLRGTFIFSFVMFSIYLGLSGIYFGVLNGEWLWFIVLLLVTSPAANFLISWAVRVWRDESEANYHSTMKMNKLGSFGMNVFYLLLLLYKVFP